MRNISYTRDGCHLVVPNGNSTIYVMRLAPPSYAHSPRFAHRPSAFAFDRRSGNASARFCGGVAETVLSTQLIHRDAALRAIRTSRAFENGLKLRISRQSQSLTVVF